ncbi:Elongator complex protein 4 [Geodia barretti]|uniref:Elongator complex protein 4 n=1 Tax=Geodia barretti TaxID=519541 RepID=A0AA35WKE6_GEOBA|nr:Elongator complex protein 4 [Geodia barretti]
MATSFKKRGAAAARPQHPLGSRPSLHNAQLLVSSGVPSMDALLGGGLAVGTVLLIGKHKVIDVLNFELSLTTAEEDVFASYSRLLLKMFLAEGVMCGHAVYLASASEDPTELLGDLPSAVGEEEKKESGPVLDTSPTVPGSKKADQMKIAWRYQNLPKVQSSFSNRFGHFFDLTSLMDPSRLASIDMTTFDVSRQLAARNSTDLYRSLKTQIQSKIKSGDFSVDSQNSLQQFLHSLRGLLRRAYAVALVTVPTHLMQDSVYVRQIERLCDSAVRIISFAGSEPNPLFQDYHGLFQLVKLPCLNSLTSHLPETLDLVFKLKRKSFSIEKRHLPPEFSDTASRAQEDGEGDKRTRGQGPRVGVVIEGQGSKVAERKSLNKLSQHNIDFEFTCNGSCEASHVKIFLSVCFFSAKSRVSKECKIYGRKREYK